METTIDKKILLTQQQNEINDYSVYSLLAKYEKDESNRAVLLRIAAEEKSHYDFLKTMTQEGVPAQKWIVYFYLFFTRLFGTSFALQLMEHREDGSQSFYLDLQKSYPQAKQIYEEETAHEGTLIRMLKDKKLAYAGAIVLGMNDALVELTGTLSGIALAFDNSMAVGVTGLIMGIAASLSMAGSAYLESRENSDGNTSAGVYAIYTGVSYILTTLLLVLPFFLFSSISYALSIMFIMAFVSIVSYSFYIAIAKGTSFKQRVLEMSFITFGVALISFGIGYSVKHFFGIDIF